MAAPPNTAVGSVMAPMRCIMPDRATEMYGVLDSAASTARSSTRCSAGGSAFPSSPFITASVTTATQMLTSGVGSVAPLMIPPSAGPYYPGIRRIVSKADPDAWSYVEATLRAASPFLGGAFDFDRFTLIEASFSMVTAPPETLSPAQRAPSPTPVTTAMRSVNCSICPPGGRRAAADRPLLTERSRTLPQYRPAR